MASSDRSVVNAMDKQKSNTSTVATESLAFEVLRHIPTPILVLSAETMQIVMANQALKKIVRQAGNETSTAPWSSEPVGLGLQEIGLEVLQDASYVRFGWDVVLKALRPQMDPRSNFFKHCNSSEWNVKEAVEPDIDEPEIVKTATVDVAFTLANELTTTPLVEPRHEAHKVDKQVSRSSKLHGKIFITPITSGGKDYFSMSVIQTFIVDLAQTSESDAKAITPLQYRVHPSLISDPVAEYIRQTDNGHTRPGNTLTPQHDTQLTILQKVAILKNALLDTMELPVFCAWLDGSLTIPNRAAMELGASTLPENDIGFVDDSWIARFRVFDKDFTRELKLHEYPLARLCRTKQPIENDTIGIMIRNNEKRIYDIGGRGVLDDKGEWIAGLIWMRDVTDVQRELVKVKEGESERFKMMCNHMPQLIWTTRPDGFHDWYSDRWYEYTGSSEKDTEGEGWQNPFHPDDLIEADIKWRDSLKTGKPYSVEYRCKRHDGVYRWMLGRALPLRDSETGEIMRWFGTCTDIENQVEARTVARRIREQLQNVMSHAAITLWQVDTRKHITLLEGRDILSTDPRKNRLNRKEMKQVVGQHIEEVFQNKEFTSPIDRVLTGESETFSECLISDKFWRTLYVPIIAEPSTGQDKGTSSDESDKAIIVGVIGVSMDITDKKNQENELAVKAEENLRLMANEAAAKEASRLKSQFLANMSHEIRTPIAGVIGMSDILLDTDLTDEQKEYAENIQRSANALLTVINDILDFSKVESGRLDIEEVQFSLSLVISDVVKMLHFDAEKKHVQFITQIHHPLCDDLQIMGDPGRVRQILTNLLTNSIKFTSYGYVKLSAKIVEEHKLPASDENAGKVTDYVVVYFEVEDTGIGITEDVRKRLFQPFGQADSSTARRFGGSGLGLAICKNLVELMGGTIDLTSEFRKGTKAFFRIPFRLPRPLSPTSDERMSLDINTLPERLQNDTSVSCRNSEASNSPRIAPSPSLTPSLYERPLSIDYRPELTESRETPSSTSREITEHPGIMRDNSPSPLELTGQILTESLSSVAPNQSDPKATLPQERRRNLHVLVVEDNPINQQIAMKVVKRLGFNVSAVWNGQEALDYLLEANIKIPKEPVTVPKSVATYSAAIQEQLKRKLEMEEQPSPVPQPEDQGADVKVEGKVIPDLILLDVQMPIKDGYETSKAIRLFPAPLRDVPIVGLTASAIKGDREKCKEAGMDDYLAKPVRVALLEKMLVKWLSAGSRNAHVKRMSPSTPPSDTAMKKTALEFKHMAASSKLSPSEEDRILIQEQMKLAASLGSQSKQPDAVDNTAS